MRRLLTHFEEIVATAALAALLVVMSLQVISRYVFDSPFSWTEEVSRHLYVYMVFFGASAAIRDRSHVAISMAVAYLPRPARLAMNVLILGFLGVMIWAGWKLVQRNLDVPTVTLEIPFAIVYAVVPIIAVLMIWRTVAQMGEDVGAYRRGAVVADDQRSVL
ncbi:MAG: TRAP transporter small permease [Alphaproteobacteria bacterium]|nr:TRAP transporter small permease [Alphaproteobacteria bacterium]